MPTKADYAKINIACKELGIDKYQILSDRYGIDSSKKLTVLQLQDLYSHFKRLGWRVKRGASKKLSPRYADAIHRKVVAMWIEMHQAGVVKNGSDQALQAYVKRQTGIENLRWCQGLECHQLIEGLKAWGEREGLDF